MVISVYLLRTLSKGQIVRWTMSRVFTVLDAYVLVDRNVVSLGGSLEASIDFSCCCVPHVVFFTITKQSSMFVRLMQVLCSYALLMPTYEAACIYISSHAIRNNKAEP